MRYFLSQSTGDYFNGLMTSPKNKKFTRVVVSAEHTFILLIEYSYNIRNGSSVMVLVPNRLINGQRSISEKILLFKMHP